MADFPINQNNRRTRIVATAGQTEFTYNFPIFAADDLLVIRVRGDVVTILAQPGDYSVAGVGAAAGGTVTLTTGADVGDVLTIAGNWAIARVTDFTGNAGFTPAALNEDFDRIVIGLQELVTAVGRALSMNELDRFDAGDKRIANLATPVDDSDAASKAYFDGTLKPDLTALKNQAEAAAGTATAKAGEAAASAASATASVTNAGDSAAAAAASQAAAAQSATDADADRVSAQAASASAGLALDQFTDIYLGAKAADPTTDNDGDALDAGALYFNVTTKEMRAYNAADSTWYSVTDAATSASAAAASATAADTARGEAVAAQGQAAAARDTAQGHASTAAGHVTDALGHANTAAGHVTTAAGHVTTASGHATTASTKAGEASGSATAAAGSAAQAATSETNAGNSASSAATSEANAAASAGVGPTLAQAVRARYAIKTRRPAVVLDPVEETYFSPAGPVVIGDLVDHVRNSTAVSTDGDGQIVSAPANTLRTDHHVLKEGIWQRAGLRVDKQATNLFVGSDDPTKWYVPATMELDPDVGIGSGGGNLFRMRGATGGSGNLRLGISNNRAVSLATVQCFSFDARADGLNRLRFNTGNEGPGIDPSTVWDVSTGDVIATGASVIHAGIHDLGDGLFRCFTVWLSSATDGAVSFNLQLCLNTTTSPGGSSAIPVDPSSSVIVGNFQHEEAVDVPSSYIKTTAAQVTRAADVIDIDAADLPTPAKACTILLAGAIDRVDADSAEEAVLFNWHIGANTEQIKLVLNSLGANDGLPELFSVAGGVSASATGAGVGLGQSGVGVEFRIALVVTATSLQVIMNGVAGAVVTHANGLPDLAAAGVDLGSNFNGTISEMRIFDTALPEAALITETTI